MSGAVNGAAPCAVAECDSGRTGAVSAVQPPLIVAKDRSRDRSYFVLTPQLVWAMCDDVYELGLWTVVKMVAGEDGLCILETGDLAALAMMSVGKLHQCRKSLLRKRLLTGSLYRDPGFSNAVWHLEVPDLWAANLQWRVAHNGLKDRVEYKRQQKLIHQVKRVVRPAPGECGLSPGECGLSPDERKENQKEDPKEELKEEQELLRIWLTVLAELEMQVTRVTYATWIRGLHLVELDRQVERATIVCATEGVRDWVSRCLDIVVRRVLAGVVGLDYHDLEMVYVVDG